MYEKTPFLKGNQVHVISLRMGKQIPKRIRLKHGRRFVSCFLHFAEPPEEEGSAIFYDLPSDPEDETQDLCTLSAQPLFPTQRITAEGGKRYVIGRKHSCGGLRKIRTLSMGYITLAPEFLIEQ